MALGSNFTKGIVMPNRVIVNATLEYEDEDGLNDSIQIVDLIKTLGTKGLQHFKREIATSETAIIPASGAPFSTLGWCMIVNRDPNNYIDLKVAASGAIFARLHPASETGEPGGFCLLYLGSGAQIPVGIANSAACYVDVFIANQ